MPPAIILFIQAPIVCRQSEIKPRSLTVIARIHHHEYPHHNFLLVRQQPALHAGSAFGVACSNTTKLSSVVWSESAKDSPSSNSKPRTLNPEPPPPPRHLTYSPSRSSVVGAPCQAQVLQRRHACSWILAFRARNQSVPNESLLQSLGFWGFRVWVIA